MINLEQRKGKKVPVIKKALVELEGSLFKTYESLRDNWALNDYFCAVGPIQFSMENMDKAPFLSHECCKEALFLSPDIPRKNYEVNRWPYAKVNIEHMSRLSYHRAKASIKLPS